MLPQEKIKNLIDRHLKLEKELSSGVIDKNKYAEISKEYSDLNEIIKHAKNYLNFEKETKDLNVIINDKNSDEEMKELASL
jgi:peptide chain release factor 1